jgi:DEAD/DEAH box helicase domain-containing protein
VLETVEESAAYTQLHPGSVYLHQAEDYLVTELDLESHTAYAQPTDAPYYTQARHLTETRVLNIYRIKPVGRSTVYLGEVSVSTTVMGFRRRSRSTHEVLGEEMVSLPTQSYDTVALWLDIPPDTLATIRAERQDLAGGLHAMEHAAIGLLPLFALCDRNDIGGISTPLHPDTGRPQVFIHDGHPGGVGITEHGYDVIEALCEATIAAISECPCESGCPSCIHSPKCGNNNQPLDKAVALWLLRDILYEPSCREAV